MPALGLKLRLNRISARILSVLTTNLQMWHKFTANPWTGSNRLPDSSPVGTNTGALFTGRGLDFDGVNDWVDCGNPNITCRSVVLYINPDVTTDNIMKLTSTINITLASGTLTATGWTSPTLYVNGVAGTSVSAGTWQQIAVTSATSFTANDLEIGRTSGLDWFAGLISNVKVFSVELSAAQIAEMYANPEMAYPTGVTANQLVGWWPLAEGSKATYDFALNACSDVIDSKSGAVGVTGFGSPAPQFALKGMDEPMHFDGVDDLVTFNNESNFDFDFNTPFTFYFAFLPQTSGNATFFHKGPNNTAGFYLLRTQGSGRVEFYMANTGTTGYTVISDVGSVPNRLTKALVTYDGNSNQNGLKVYINGVLTKTGTSLATSGTMLNNNQIIMGANRAGTERYKGVVIEAAVWAASLSANAITDINAQGLNFNFLQNSGNYNNSGNLRAWWKNKGATDAGWLDLSGNANHGILSGSPVTVYMPEGITPGKDIYNQSLQNPNTGNLILNDVSYASVADAASLDITSAITLEAWIRPTALNVNQTIIGKNNAYALNITSAAKLQFQRWSGATSGTILSSASLVANGWRHVAITYNGTTTAIYINGVLDTSSTAISGAIDATSTAVLLGALTTTTQQFSGYIDNARIYSVVLTAAQIAGNYKAEKGGYN